ncbi:efflux RND transporter periplasmic adaptor subunit [Paucibacter sp. R3-3]|uniref:Efflux RND transporter periplasmic adaptor subunit n=1 Tax=Roseateles agri TaxID=3098619 RepID=A0ABU5DCY2_9BURK|nr:efflux RND transporter periplasmic adaptor subunit [Paucibacter sp. R3-3]MDY0743144.1 efflux RND transporter periplasmic adaptor subunit [Paucibacter sp. R3-3]
MAGVVIVGALAAGGAWWLMANRAVPVTVAAAQAVGGSGAAAGAVLQATGYIVARRQATVSTQITGTLTAVYIDAGDKVTKGQVLARLEDASQRAALDAARANARSAEAQIEQARAQLTQAQADARRQRDLLAQGMVSPQAAEQADTAVVVNQTTVLARQRAADASRAQLAEAQVQFDYTTVRAPFAGVVTAKAAQVGEIVSPLSAGGGFTRTGVGTIVDMDSLEIEVDVNEASIGQVKPDMPCEAVLDAYPDWKIPAHVIAIIPTADRGKATVKVRVGLDQKDQRMVPDMGARVSFLREAEKKATAGAPPARGVLIPAQAVVQRDGDSVVFTLGSDGHVHQRKVKAAGNVGELTRIPDGIEAGEQVVLSPPATLKDGAAATTATAATSN